MRVLFIKVLFFVVKSIKFSGLAFEAEIIVVACVVVFLIKFFVFLSDFLLLVMCVNVKLFVFVVSVLLNILFFGLSFEFGIFLLSSTTSVLTVSLDFASASAKILNLYFVNVLLSVVIFNLYCKFGLLLLYFFIVCVYVICGKFVGKSTSTSFLNAARIKFFASFMILVLFVNVILMLSCVNFG